jgi:hypothetical protein
MGQRAADYQVATLLSLCPGSRFKCAERTTSIVGFTANRIDPIKKSQSAARVVEVKKKKPARSGQTAENPGRSGHRNPGDFGEATLTDLGEAVAYRGPYRIIGQSGVEVFDVGHGVLSHGGTEGGSHQLTPNPLACRLPAFSTRRCLFNDQSVPKPCTSGNVDRSRVWASSPRRNASLRTSVFTSAAEASIGPVFNHRNRATPIFASTTTRLSSSARRWAVNRCASQS